MVVLSQKIEDLLESKAENFEVAKVIREDIKKYFNSIDIILQNNQGKDFFVKHAKKIDEFIQIIYKYVIRYNFQDYMPFINSIPIVLSALGSYGREELCIHSDIDLMIVYKKIDGFNTDTIIEAILQMMWDSNIKIGHRVHEVKDLFVASKEDITIKTAMLEARYICGSKLLWVETQRELNAIRHYKQKDYILHKYFEYAQRTIQKPLNMEPNIKDGAGGLRDINTLYWIINTLYNGARIKDVVPFVISEKDYKEIRMALEFLYKVRLTLHLISGKKRDVLIMELLPDIAKKLKFKDTIYKSAALQLSSKTFECLWIIKINCNILIKKIMQPFLFEKKNIASFRKNRISKHFFLCQNIIYTSFHHRREKLKNILLEILELPDKNYKYDISIIYYLKNSVIPKKIEQDINEIVKKFLYKQHIYELFYALYQAKLIDKIITPVKKVIYLAQFDGYHHYPVDIHSIKVLKYLENIEDNFIKYLYETLDEEEKSTLRLVAFLHDAGKGRKKDHSFVGAELFKVYAKKIGFKDRYIKTGSLLIEHHTLMSNVANREDIYNEKTILRFLSKIKTKKNLQMLYILTYADINGVGEGIYSFFSAKLLKELYEISINSFINKNLITETARRVRREKILKKSKEFQNFPKILQKKLLSIPANFLFLKYKTPHIIDISKWAYDLNISDKEFDYHIDNSRNLTISIIRKKELNVGFLLGKLSYLNLVNMDIFKLFEGIKYFKIEFLEEIGDDEIVYIKELVENSFDMTKKVKYNKPLILRKEIVINCNHSKSYGEMILNTKDQKGLMAYLIAVFDDIGIDIVSAKIQTIRKRAINLFILEKNGRFCHNINKIYDIIC